MFLCESTQMFLKTVQSNDNLSALSLLDSEVFMFQMDKQRKSYKLDALKPSLAHHII